MEPSSLRKESALSLLQVRANITKKETSANVVSSSRGSEFENSSLNGVKENLICPKRSPRLLCVSRFIPEQDKSAKPQTMPSNSVKQRKVLSGSNKDSNSSSDDLKPFQNRTTSQRSRAQSSIERLKGISRTISQGHVENTADLNHS